MVSQLKVLTNGVIYGGDRFDADGTEIDTSAKGFWMSSDGTLKAVLQSLNYETFLAGTDAGKNIPNNSACNWNTFTGTEAGKGSGAGGFPSQNAGYGYQSLFGINAGLNNSGFGPRSLYKLYNGDRNSGFGVTSLYNLYNGDSNSGFGVNSLVDCTGGSGNTAFGDSSAADITTGNYNACFGTGTHCYSTTLDYQININNTKKYIEFASTATQNTVYDAIVSLTNVSSGYISCSGYFGSNIFNTGIITSSTLSLYMGVSGAVGTFTNDSSTAIGSSLQIEVMTKRTPTNS